MYVVVFQVGASEMTLKDVAEMQEILEALDKAEVVEMLYIWEQDPSTIGKSLDEVEEEKEREQVMRDDDNPELNI